MKTRLHMDVCRKVACSLVFAASCTIAVPAVVHSQERLSAVSRQLAEANQWLIGTWVWTSEWGPITLTFKGTNAQGRPVGRIEISRGNVFRDCDEKPGAATMVCTLTGSKLHILFSAAEYQLSRQGNALVGRYSAARIVRDANFIKQ